MESLSKTLLQDMPSWSNGTPCPGYKLQGKQAYATISSGNSLISATGSAYPAFPKSFRKGTDRPCSKALYHMPAMDLVMSLLIGSVKPAH